MKKLIPLLILLFFINNNSFAAGSGGDDGSGKLIGKLNEYQKKYRAKNILPVCIKILFSFIVLII